MHSQRDRETRRGERARERERERGKEREKEKSLLLLAVFVVFFVRGLRFLSLIYCYIIELASFSLVGLQQQQQPTIRITTTNSDMWL